jgi:hypothetical protein
MANAKRDDNHVPTLIGVSSVDGVTPTLAQVNPATGRLLVDLPGSTGTVTSVSVVPANGFSGTVATPTTTPAITLTTTITGTLQGNGTAISASKVALTQPATGSTLTILDGKTLTVINTLTLTATDGSTLAIGAGGTLGSNAYTSTAYAPIASPTFTGVVTMPTPFTLGAISVTSTGTQLNYVNAATGTTGTTNTNVVFSTSPTLVTPVLGVASATTVNKVTLTTPATGSTLTILDGKTLTANNSLTLAGTDSTTMTFPTTSATIARTDAAQTFTGTQTFSQQVMTVNAITAAANAATVPITSRISNVTNNSAATLTITLTTASAVDGMMVMVRIFDFSAVAQTLVFVNTENSTVVVPITSNGSTTLPLTAAFMYNAGTSKWRCIASA